MPDRKGTEAAPYITVAALRAALDGEPDDALVVLSKDGEGNGFSPLSEVECGQTYEADTTWSGSVTGDGEGEGCVVLWPTN